MNRRRRAYLVSAVSVAALAAATVLLMSQRSSIDSYESPTNSGEAQTDRRLHVHQERVESGESRPNVILITVDTLRADFLGCYGHPNPTSPRVDQFAGESLLFQNCYAHAPVTSSSCASILSGFLPHETAVYGNLPLPAEVETLPEILRRQGYTTVGVVSNINLTASRGWSQGFDVFDDEMDDREATRGLPEKIAERATDRAIELLEGYHDDRLFLWVHYQDPHGPYTPPDDFGQLFRDSSREPRQLSVNKSISGYGGIPEYQRLGTNTDYFFYVSQYEGEIRYFDEHFGRLIDAVKRLGLYDDSLIIFTADHGEGMGEHDYFFAHGENLLSTVTRVPLILKHGNDHQGVRTDFVQHLDIVPTILRVLAMSVEDRFRGGDLRGPVEANKEILVEKELLAIGRGRSHMYSLLLDGLELSHVPLYGRYQLFDLRVDPYQQTDLLYDQSYQEQIADLKDRLERIREENLIGHDIVNKPHELSDEERRKLRSLGYVW
jgi:arylsulfatase